MVDDLAYVRQAAAIPVRNGKVCLITSSNGKRWIIPKGLIDPGHTAGEAALQEAWEEAGLTGALQQEPVGSYLYEKLGRTYHVTVFWMNVTDAADEWPERSLRQRSWVTTETVLERIEDPALVDLLRLTFDKDGVVQPA
jgi:8-oxo-dGTP pyrophosphatase MutT (NUDIX family)